MLDCLKIMYRESLFQRLFTLASISNEKREIHKEVTMKNLRQFSVYSSAVDGEDRTLASTTGVSQLRKQGTDVIIRNNPKIDSQLLAEHERLAAASKSAGEKRGADYNLAHPLARPDMPTDAYHLGQSVSEVKKS